MIKKISDHEVHVYVKDTLALECLYHLLSACDTRDPSSHYYERIQEIILDLEDDLIEGSTSSEDDDVEGIMSDMYLSDIMLHDKIIVYRLTC